MTARLLNLFKIAATLAIILFLLTRIDLTKMAAVLAHAQPLPLAAALGLYFFALLLGGYKWWVLVRAQGIPASLAQVVSYSLVALFFGNLLPSNVGGDVVRAYDLTRATPERREGAAITVLVDRLIGLVAFVSMAVLMAAWTTAMLARAEMQEIELASVAVAVILIGGSALLFSRRVARRGALVFARPPLVRFRPLAERIYNALQVYRHRPDALALNGVVSLAIVVVTSFVWYAVARGLGIDAPLLFFFLFNPLIAFVLLIPISFNGLGAKEAAAVFFFGLVGVPQEAAFSMSLLFHLIIVLTSLPGGFLWWRQRNLAPAEGESVKA